MSKFTLLFLFVCVAAFAQTGQELARQYFMLESEKKPEPPPVVCPQPCPPPPVEDVCFDPILFFEGKVAYFHPADDKIQDIYSNHTGIYGLEVCWRGKEQYFGLWGSASYLYLNGHSIGSGSRTNAHIVPLGLGIAYLQNVYDRIDIFLGVGVLYSRLVMHDYSPYVFPTTTKWDWGGIWKAGLRIYPIKHLFVDVFTDYSYMKFNFSGCFEKVVFSSPNFSGISAGVAIGYDL